jgi:hypothetical protein
MHRGSVEKLNGSRDRGAVDPHCDGCIARGTSSIVQSLCLAARAYSTTFLRIRAATYPIHLIAVGLN